MTEFTQELEHLLNRHSLENGSNTPDFLLATFMVQCLGAYNRTTRERDRWYGIHLEPGHTYFKISPNAKEPI